MKKEWNFLLTDSRKNSMKSTFYTTVHGGENEKFPLTKYFVKSTVVISRNFCDWHIAEHTVNMTEKFQSKSGQ